MTFEQLMIETTPAIIKELSRWGGLKTDKEDIKQEIWLEIYKKIDKVNEIIDNGGTYKEYCKQIARNVCRHIFEKEHKQLLYCEGQIIDGVRYDGKYGAIDDEYLQRMNKRDRERSKKYYWEHREKQLAYQKQYRKDNIEKVRESQKDYRQRNKEKYREYARQYYQEHREQQNEYGKRYYQEHKEKCKEYRKQYREQNKEKIAEQQREYNRKRWQKVKDLQQEIIEQHGVHICSKKVERLLRAKKKSEEQYKELLGEYLLEKKG